MLVLSRRQNETVVVTAGDTRITIAVVQLLGDKVRLGVEAPREVTIHRGEVQKIVDQEQSAGELSQ